MPSEIQITKSVLNGSIPQRIDTVAKFATALNLGKQVEIHHHMSKAHKGERITAPHLIPELWNLEKQFHALMNPKKVTETILNGIGIHKKLWKGKWGDKPIYKGDGTPFTENELEHLETLLAEALTIPRYQIRRLILKAALVGKLTGIKEAGKKMKIEVGKLPETIRAAIKENMLTAQEVQSLQFAHEYASVNVTAMEDRYKSEIKRMVLQAQANREHPRTLARRMFNEIADGDSSFARDWERVAITEMNRTASDGFIGGQPDGNYVVGNAHDDACTYCISRIEGKVYRVSHENPPEDYSEFDPKSKEYRDMDKRWDQEIWVGKSNYGRSFSPRKRTEDGLVPREQHEMAKGVIPLHPNCRCRYTPFMPDMAYIKDGKVKFVLGDKDEKERVKWVKKNSDLFQGNFQEARLTGT